MFKVTSDKIDLNIEASLPCDACNSFCCSSDVLFDSDEIKRLKNKYRSVFKRVKILDSEVPNHYRLRLKGKGGDKCVFLDKNNKCSIYEDRPFVCKDYGEKVFIRCPFENMSDVEVSSLSMTDKKILEKKTNIENRKWIMKNYNDITVRANYV